MTAITISREFGSEGDTIARSVAQALDYHFVDQEFIGAILSQYGLVEFDREYETLLGFWDKFNAQREKRRDEMVEMLNRVLRAVARHGNVVILGRSGFAVLSDFADVLHVRLQAPFAVRAAQVMAQQQIALEAAEELVAARDKVRMAFVEEFYRVPWDAAHAFDLVINTAKISPENAAAWIIQAAQTFTASLKTDMPTTASIKVDSVLAHAISESLGCNLAHNE